MEVKVLIHIGLVVPAEKGDIIIQVVDASSRKRLGVLREKNYIFTQSGKILKAD